MKKLTLLLLFSSFCFAQYEYPIAPEIWSTPKPIASIEKFGGYYPSISWDGNKLFFTGAYYIEKTDTGWSEAKTITSIDKNLVIAPCISPNGKRLFFTWFLDNQGWDLFYIDWDSTVNDWGSIHNAGPGINKQDYAERGVTMPNDTTIIFLRGNNAFISYYQRQINEWKEAHQFSKIQDVEYFCFGSDWGIYISPNFKKVYTTSAEGDTTIDGKYYFNYYIIVSYQDTSNISCGYAYPPKILNICFQSDSLYHIGKYKGRWEGCPSLTPDGKTMYFAADYYGRAMIFETHMLIDENGDTVTGVIDKEVILPNEIELLPPYPNPFNPETTIEFILKNETDLKLSVYNILGEEIKILKKGRFKAGKYKEKFSMLTLQGVKTSSVYFILLQTNRGDKTQKVILIK